MITLPEVKNAIADLNAIELHELTKWLFEHKLARMNHETESPQDSMVSNCNRFVLEPFRGTLVKGSSESGKSSQLKKPS